jgi:hypothetical protein
MRIFAEMLLLMGGEPVFDWSRSFGRVLMRSADLRERHPPLCAVK